MPRQILPRALDRIHEIRAQRLPRKSEFSYVVCHLDKDSDLFEPVNTKGIFPGVWVNVRANGKFNAIINEQTHCFQEFGMHIISEDYQDEYPSTIPNTIVLDLHLPSNYTKLGDDEIVRYIQIMKSHGLLPDYIDPELVIKERVMLFKFLPLTPCQLYGYMVHGRMIAHDQTAVRIINRLQDEIGIHPLVSQVYMKYENMFNQEHYFDNVIESRGDYNSEADEYVNTIDLSREMVLLAHGIFNNIFTNAQLRKRCEEQRTYKYLLRNYPSFDGTDQINVSETVYGFEDTLLPSGYELMTPSEMLEKIIPFKLLKTDKLWNMNPQRIWDERYKKR